MIGTLFETLLWVSIGLILWQYIGYAAVVVVLARLLPDRAPRRPRAPGPKVSMIVAAFNERDVMDEKVRGLCALTYPLLELIVMTDGSDDGTDRVARAAGQGRVLVLHQPERQGKAAALNRAAEVATGDILVFSDANTMLAPDVLDHLLEPFEDERVAVVSGRKTILARPDAETDEGFARSEGLYWRYEDKIRWAEDRLGNTVATVGELLCIRRRFFHPIPGWVVNDDAYLTLHALKAGGVVRYARAAESREYASVATADEHARRRRMSAGRWRLMMQPRLWPISRPFVMLSLISHKWLRLWMPVLFALALLANVGILAAGGDPLAYGGLLIAQLMFHGAAALGAGQGAASGWIARLLRLCYFVEAANLSALRGLRDVLSGQANVLWPKARR